MTRSRKLILVCITFVAILAVAYYEVNEYWDRKEEENNKEQTKTVDEIFNQYIENEKAREEETEKDENTTTNTTSNTNKATKESAEKVEVKGTDDEKAIALAKNTWGAQDDAVAFNIAKKEGKTYYVSVNNKETTAVLAWYEINIENGEVSDY